MLGLMQSKSPKSSTFQTDLMLQGLCGHHDIKQYHRTPAIAMCHLLQGMMANRYMDTFRDDILGWNKKLMNVADVNELMTKIQRTWAYLESLFIYSEEVKKELPDAARRFANIDSEVKSILKVRLAGISIQTAFR